MEKQTWIVKEICKEGRRNRTICVLSKYADCKKIMKMYKEQYCINIFIKRGTWYKEWCSEGKYKKLAHNPYENY